MFDRVTYTSYSNDFHIYDVMPGDHYLQIIRSQVVRQSLRHLPATHNMVEYSGCIKVPCSSKVFAVLDCYHRLSVNAEPIYERDQYFDQSYNFQQNDCHAQTAVCPPRIMDPVSFNNLVNSIQNKWFESSKLEIAKQALSSNYVSSMQVKQLMSLFSFESSKIDLAKFAYSKVIDKQNYYVVNDAFTFESSIRELNHYLYG